MGDINQLIAQGPTPIDPNNYLQGQNNALNRFSAMQKLRDDQQARQQSAQERSAFPAALQGDKTALGQLSPELQMKLTTYLQSVDENKRKQFKEFNDTIGAASAGVMSAPEDQFPQVAEQARQSLIARGIPADQIPENAPRQWWEQHFNEAVGADKIYKTLHPDPVRNVAVPEGGALVNHETGEIMLQRPKTYAPERADKVGKWTHEMGADGRMGWFDENGIGPYASPQGDTPVTSGGVPLTQESFTDRMSPLEPAQPATYPPQMDRSGLDQPTQVADNGVMKDWKPAPKGGGTVTTNEDGSVTVTPKTSDTSKTAAGYAKRMVDAETRMSEVADKTDQTGLANKVFGGTRFSGYLTDPNYQILRQSQEDWVRAKLRKESGAVIGNDEMEAEIRTYFPQPGENDPAVIENKAHARQIATEAMIESAGGAYTAREAPLKPRKNDRPPLSSFGR